MQQQKREQRTRLRAAELQEPALALDLQRPQDAEFHGRRLPQLASESTA